MAKNDKILFNGNTTTNLGYTQLKKAAQEVLDLTGTSFTWEQSVGQGSVITTDQINEIIDAIDAAHNNISLGCNADNSSQHSTNCTHEASGNSSVKATNYTSRNGSHDSSLCESANGSVNSGKMSSVRSGLTGSGS